MVFTLSSGEVSFACKRDSLWAPSHMGQWFWSAAS